MAVSTGRDVLAERAEIDAIVEGKSICHVFAERVKSSGPKVAIKGRSESGWTTLTWDEYRERVTAATLGLIGLGFKPGDLGLILARNIPEHVIADLALIHAGGAAVSLYLTLAPQQVEYIANHSEAKVAFVENLQLLEKLEAVRDRLPYLQHIVLIEGEREGTVSWQRLLEDGRAAHAADPEAFARSWQAVTPGDLASLIYTSGTTGPPKGVMYSHRNVVWTCESSLRLLSVDEGTRMLSYLPLSHVAERFSTHWLGIYRAGVTHYLPDLTQLGAALLEVRPEFFVAVPRVWEKFYAALNAGLAAEPDAARREAVLGLLAASRQIVKLEQAGEPIPAELEAQRPAIAQVSEALRAKLGLDECQLAVTSTAPTPVEIQEFFAALGLPLLEVWGQSELTGPATANPNGGMRIGTIGIAYPGQEVKLADDGEILVRGGNVMMGYYKEPLKTAETIDDEGWVHTGDIGTMDADGYFRIIDRKKELIITSGGKNISPANIESTLKFNPLVGQACAIGDARAYITALVVLDPEVAPGWAQRQGIEFESVADLARDERVRAEIQRGVEAANQNFSRQEQVKKFTILPVEWTAESEELTPTLKLKRRVIMEKYAVEIEAMYAPEA